MRASSYFQKEATRMFACTNVPRAGMRCGLPCGLRALFEPSQQARCHVAPNAVPVGTRYVGDAAVCLEEFVGHLEHRQHQSRGRSAGPEVDP